MKQPKFLVFALFALIVTILTGTSFAQSTDRDHPTPLNSAEISGSFIDHQKDGNKEIFYSFTAGPGELSITVDVKRRDRENYGGVSFEILPGNGASTALLCCEGVQMGEGGTGREIATVKLTKRQTVILHITNAFDGGGIFNVRLSGAAFFGGPSSGGSGSGDGIGNGQGRGNRGGEQINVPASGTLHIRMKNGTTKDIDLSLIQTITVRP